MHSLLKLHFFHLFICSSSTKQFNLYSYFKQIRFCSEFHFHFKIRPCRSCWRCGHFQQINTFWLNYFFNGIINIRSNRWGSGDVTRLSASTGCQSPSSAGTPKRGKKWGARERPSQGTGDTSPCLSAAPGSALITSSA